MASRTPRDGVGIGVLRFGLLSLVEAVSAPGIGGGRWLTTGQLLMLYTVESLLVGLGLASIAYSVLRY